MKQCFRVIRVFSGLTFASAMKVLDTELAGLKIIELDVFGDGRGRFLETYRASRYDEAGIDADFVQDNVSVSQRGVLRGMHWQDGANAQAKLVCILAGAAWDVVVDIRRDSPTFGKWKAVELSATNGRQLFIPRGFAHGFLALEDDTIFGYKCDNYYDKASERGFMFDDPEVGIAWPEVDGGYVLSPKDRIHPSFREACGAIGR